MTSRYKIQPWGASLRERAPESFVKRPLKFDPEFVYIKGTVCHTARLRKNKVRLLKRDNKVKSFFKLG